MAIERFHGDLTKLGEWCKYEYQLALINHESLEARYKEEQRLYDAQPRTPYRIWPWPGASNIEIPLAMTHTATVTSRIEDAYFASSPWCVIKANDSKWREHCGAFQRWNNQVELVNAQYKEVKKHSILSTTKFGTSYNHLQWKQQASQVWSNGKWKKVVHHDGPMIYYIHPNNIVYPYNTMDVQGTRWIGFRSFKPWHELIGEFYEGHYSRSVMDKLKSEGRKITDPFDNWKQFVKRGQTNLDVDLWEVVTMFAFYQDEMMQLPQNLWITFHYPSGIILEAIYNPLGHFQRPLFKSDYMIEDGRFPGMGIVGLLRMLQNEMSDSHNYRMDNMFLANTTMVAAKKNAYDKFEIAPMSVISTFGEPKDTLQFMRPGEIYPSITGAEDIANAYAERLTGVGDANIPRLGSFRGAAGVRTPATTTLALIGEGNKRFTVAIGNAKDSDNLLLKQFIQLEHQFWPRRRGDCYAWNPRDAKLIDAMMSGLSGSAFVKNIVAEVGASTAAVNKESERQNIIMITNELMVPMFNYLVQLATMQEQFPNLQPIIEKAYNSTIQWTIMALETFDVRDPSQYLPSRTDVGSSVTPADAAQRSENFGSSFVTQAFGNADQGTFTNGQRGVGAAAVEQGAGRNGNG